MRVMKHAAIGRGTFFVCGAFLLHLYTVAIGHTQLKVLRFELDCYESLAQHHSEHVSIGVSIASCVPTLQSKLARGLPL